MKTAEAQFGRVGSAKVEVVNALASRLLQSTVKAGLGRLRLGHSVMNCAGTASVTQAHETKILDMRWVRANDPMN